MNPEQIKKGVDEALGFWLYDHPISTEAAIEAGVKQAVSEWLSDRMGAADIENAIKNVVSEWLDEHKPDLEQ